MRFRKYVQSSTFTYSILFELDSDLETIQSLGEPMVCGRPNNPLSPFCIYPSMPRPQIYAAFLAVFDAMITLCVSYCSQVPC